MGTVSYGLRKGTIIYNEEDNHYYRVTANDTIFNGNHQAIGLKDITGSIDGTSSSTFQINKGINGPILSYYALDGYLNCSTCSRFEYEVALKNTGVALDTCSNNHFNNNLDGWTASGSGNITINSTSRVASNSSITSEYCCSSNVTTTDTMGTYTLTFTPAVNTIMATKVTYAVKISSIDTGTTSYAVIQNAGTSSTIRTFVNNEIVSTDWTVYTNTAYSDYGGGSNETSKVEIHVFDLPVGTFDIMITGIDFYYDQNAALRLAFTDKVQLLGTNTPEYYNSATDTAYTLYHTGNLDVSKCSRYLGEFSTYPTSFATGDTYYNTTIPAIQMYINETVTWITIGTP